MTKIHMVANWSTPGNTRLWVSLVLIGLAVLGKVKADVKTVNILFSGNVAKDTPTFTTTRREDVHVEYRVWCLGSTVINPQTGQAAVKSTGVSLQLWHEKFPFDQKWKANTKGFVTLTVRTGRGNEARRKDVAGVFGVDSSQGGSAFCVAAELQADEEPVAVEADLTVQVTGIDINLRINGTQAAGTPLQPFGCL